MRVTLDVGPAVHQSAGLSRYTERLASHLLRHQTDRVDLTLFYNTHSGHQLPATLRNAKTRTVPLGQYLWRLSVLATQLLKLSLYRRLIPSAPHLYHATEHLLPYLPCPTVLTVHDLIFERYPQHHTWRNRLFLKLAMPQFVRAATTIIAVSQHTKRDLVDLYGAPADKIRVVYEGIDAEFDLASSAEVARVRQSYSPERPYLLMVGTLEPRKNHAAAMRALARLKAVGQPHRLVIAGGRGWLFAPVQQQVMRLGLENDVLFAGYVPAADLPALYRGAECVLLPSLYEGFGFTPLEAMACGTPVVCSNVSSLPEVVGDAALLIAPEDDEALAAAIQRVIAEPGLAERLRERGIAQAARFTWRSCAARTVDVYEEVMERRR